MSKYKLELTDTFGGEANYTWVKRTTLELPEGAGDKWLGVFAREWAGFTGVRCEVENDGNFGLMIRPRGMCQVLFVQFDDNPTEISVEQVVEWAEQVSKAGTTEAASLVRQRECMVAAAVVAAVAMVEDPVSRAVEPESWNGIGRYPGTF